MEYYYFGNANKYKLNIILCLYNILGYDLANQIYVYCKKYNDKMKHNNLYYHNLIYKTIAPLNKSLNDMTIFRNPYFKNEIFECLKQFNLSSNVISNKRNCLRLIKIINQPKFICKTDENLKGKCFSVKKYLYDDGNTNRYFNDMDILMNIKREKVDLFDKIKIIKKLETINKNIINNTNRIWWGNDLEHELYYNLYLHIYNNYISFLYGEDVCEPGYIIDKNGIIYGH